MVMSGSGAAANLVQGPPGPPVCESKKLISVIRQCRLKFIFDCQFCWLLLMVMMIKYTDILTIWTKYQVIMQLMIKI